MREIKITGERANQHLSFGTGMWENTALLMCDDGNVFLCMGDDHGEAYTRDDARQLAAILLHFAETGELKGGGE